MKITSPAQAMEILDDEREEAAIREAAIRYLTKCPTSEVIARLVQALQDDDYGVRWEAATVLAQQGETALLEVLKALTDPKRVGDPRVRECAYHILHNNPTSMPVPITELLDALRGSAADIASLVEADRVLRKFEKYLSAKAQASVKPSMMGTARTSLFTPGYGPAD